MGASGSMQAAPPAQPAAPRPFVRPVQQDQQIRAVKPSRRPPQVHVGLGTIKIIKEYITKVMVGQIIVLREVFYLLISIRRMLLPFHRHQSL